MLQGFGGSSKGLNINGKITTLLIDQKLKVGGDVLVKGNLQTKNLQTGNLIVKKDSELRGNLSVNGGTFLNETNINGPLFINTDIVTTGNIVTQNGILQFPPCDDILVGNSCTAILTNKDITDATNFVRATQIHAVVIDSTPTIANQILVTTAPNIASWQPIMGGATGPTGATGATGATGPTGLTGATGATGSGNGPQILNIPVSDTEWRNMFTSPIPLLAAPPAGSFYGMLAVWYSFTYGGAPFVGGGQVNVQWGATINGAGQAAGGTLSSAQVVGLSTNKLLTTAVAGQNADRSLIEGLGLYLSNRVAAFTGGAGSSIIITIIVYTGQI